MAGKFNFKNIFNKSKKSLTFNVRKWGSVTLFGKTLYGYNFKEYVNNGFGRNPYVYMVVSKISKTISLLDYELKNKKGKEITSGALYDLFEKPNDAQSFSTFIENISQELLITGNAIIVADTIEGFSSIQQLRVLQTKNTDIILNNINEIEYYESIEFDRRNKYYPSEVLHIKFTNIIGEGKQSLFGLSPLESAVLVYTAANNILEAEDSIFRNRGITEILTNDTEQPMLEEDRLKLQQQWDNNTAGTSKFGQVMITNEKLRNLKLGTSSSDMELLKSTLSKMRTICSIYGVDSSLFNDPENKTYNNRVEAQKAFYLDTVLPLAEMIINEISWFVDNTLEISIDRSKIDALKEVNQVLSTKVLSELQAGLLTIEEAKAILYPKLS